MAGWCSCAGPRCRPGASFALMWLLPLAVPLADTAKFVLAVAGFVLFSTAYTVVLMPYLALLPEIAPDYDDRTRTNSYRFTFALISNMLAFTLPPAVVVAVTGADDLASSPPAGWLMMAAIFGAIIAASFLITGTMLLGTLFGVAILAFPLWAALSARLGKRAALILGLVLQSGSLLALVTVAPAGQLSAVLFAVVVVNGLGVSAVTLFPWSMLPDVVEFDELERGRRREGIFFALFTFGQKTAGSVGVFANGMVVAVFGYRQGIAVQSDFTVRGLESAVGPVAASVFGLAMLAAWRYPITRREHRWAQEELATRRGETSSEDDPDRSPSKLPKGEVP